MTLNKIMDNIKDIITYTFGWVYLMTYQLLKSYLKPKFNSFMDVYNQNYLDF